MQVLLIQPHCIGLNPPIRRIEDRDKRNTYLPIGVALVASNLIKHGHEVEILDLHNLLLTRQEVYERIRAASFDVYGISGMSPQYTYVKQLATLIKEIHPTKKVVMGGPLASYSSELLLEKCLADVCVRGEGEETTVELLRNLDDPFSVAGITYRAADDRIIVNPERQITGRIRKYPMPAYQLFDMERYMKAGFYPDDRYPKKYLAKYEGMRILNVLAGIGCPYTCKFCTTSVRKYRVREIDEIMNEVHFLMDRYNVQGLHFGDELLIVSKGRTLEMCKRLKEIGLLWCGQARSNSVDDEVAEALKESGCVAVGLGIESGSDFLLRQMKKNATVEHHLKALAALNKYDIPVKIQLLFGYPGETHETAFETVDLMKRIGYPGRRFNILVPLPGSALYDEVREAGMIDDEDAYLTDAAKAEAGFDSKRMLLNLTDMSDEECSSLVREAEKRMGENYQEILSSDLRRRWRIRWRTFWILAIHYARKIRDPYAWKRKISQILGPAPQGKVFSKLEYYNLFCQLAGQESTSMALECKPSAKKFSARNRVEEEDETRLMDVVAALPERGQLGRRNDIGSDKRLPVVTK